MQQVSHRSSVLNRYRRHPRVRIPAPFVCVLSQRHSLRWLRKTGSDLGVVYDLSISGARVSTEAEIVPGDEVTLTLRLPKQINPADIAIATVRWTKDQFCGLAFKQLSPVAQNQLRKYVSILSSTAA